MPRNTLSDLTNHLFAELERLSDESLDKEQLKMEINRAKAIKDVAGAVVSNSRLMLNAMEFRSQYGDEGGSIPKMLQ